MKSTVNTGDSWRRHEAVYDRFEEAWSVGGGPRVEEFLPPQGAPERLTVLNELVRIDLERNWERGQPVHVEDYLQRFPELAADGAAPLSLIRHEIQVRRSRGNAPNADELRRRFPNHLDSLLREPETPLVIPPASSSPVVAEMILPGSRLGRYEVRAELGRGGFASVYRAFDPELGREVAIKVPRPDLFGDSETSPRVLREARSAARLRHPAIVALHEVSQEGPRTMLVYEFVAGPTLAQLLRETRPSPQQAARWATTLAEALEYAHANGVVHRDVKPANVLMRGGIEPVLADFGLARHDEALTQLTRPGDVLGTPAYMSPEQAAGLNHQVNRGSDVYSLGVVLYEMLAGRVPFIANAPAVLNQIIHDEPPPPGGPRDLETICLKAMAKDPARRYAAAGEFAADLRRYLNHEPIHARRVGPVGKLWRWCRREPRVAGLAAAVAALLLVTAGAGVWLVRQNQRQESARFETELRDLDRELGFIGREEFALVPQMDQPRRQALEELAAKCRALLQERGERPELRQKMAEVQLRLGTIYELLGHYAEAEAAYRDAGPVPGGSEGAIATRSRYQLANLLVALGRFDDAERLFKQALELQPGQEFGAEVQHKLGNLYVMTGRFDEGRSALEQALYAQRQLAEFRPAAADRQLALAQTETSLANLLTTTCRFKEALELFNAAIDREDALSASRNEPIHRLGLARSLAGRSRLYHRTSRPKERTADLVRSYELFKKLAAEHPHRPDYRTEAAGALHSLHDYTQDAEALAKNVATKEQRYRDAIVEQERLVAEFPGVLENHRRLAVSLDDLATWLNDRSSSDGFWNKIESVTESLVVHRRSQAIWRELVAKHPEVLSYQDGLATSHQRYGILLKQLDRLDEAERIHKEGLVAQAALAEKYPNVTFHRIKMCALNNNIGVTYDRRNDLPTAERYFGEGVVHGRKAYAINPLDPVAQELLSVSLENLAEILFREGRYQEAAPLLNESHAVYRPAWWNARRVYGRMRRCVNAANDDPKLTTARRAELVRQYEDWTLADVRKTFVDTPYDDPDALSELRNNVELEWVRHRPEFQQLLRDLEAKYQKSK